MPSQGYYDWLEAGEPYHDAQPVADLARTLRGHGYTVWTKGDASHMRAVPAEDHTPYSETGWPVASPRWYGHALDIADPAETGRPDLPTLAQLGAQLFADCQANTVGAHLVKYMNWEPGGSSGPCYHDSWQPSWKRSTSGDRGHIHVSVRSDATHDPSMSGYDPVARLRGQIMISRATEQQIAVTNRRVQAFALGEAQYEETWSTKDDPNVPETNWLVTKVAEIAGKVDAIAVGGVDVDALADAVAARVLAGLQNSRWVLTQEK